MKSSLAYQTLFDDVDTVPIFPSTRYQGSKLKFLDWIWNCVKDIPFTTLFVIRMMHNILRK